MHCPSCGNESSLDQKFCRKCGFDLAAVSKLLTGPTADETAALERKRREQVLVGKMFRGIIAGLIIVGIGVLMLIAGGTFALGKTFGLLSTAMMLAGIAVTCSSLFSAMMRGTATSELKETAHAGTPEFEKAPTTRQLEGDRIPVPPASVTERSTQLIDKKR